MTRYTNKGLMAYARYMLEYKSPYWYGTYGQIGSEALYQEKKRQYPSQYTKWDKSTFTAQYGKKVHDCSGFPKGYLDNPTIDASGMVQDYLKPSVYHSEWDWSANETIKRCKEQGDISTIPEIEGLVVWKDGHMGLYDLNGWVIEEAGHMQGTIRTRLSDKKWQKWGKHPAIEYLTEPAPTPTGCSVKMPVLHKYDKNNQVSLMQLCLWRKQYLGKNGKELEIDKSFGGNSEFALNAFKKDHGMPQDSTCDEATWQVLLGISYS